MKKNTLPKLVFELSKAFPRILPCLKIQKTLYNHLINGTRFDLIVDVTTPQGTKRKFFIDVRQLATPRRVREGVRQLKAYLLQYPRGYPLLASLFLSPRVREICKEEGIGYLDLAGNCFLEFNGFYFEKVVDKNPFPQRGRPASIFTPISSRIIRVLLEKKQSEWQVAELAREAGVSLGQTSNVTRQLLEGEYLIKVNNKLKLQQAGKLLDSWRSAYKPKLNERIAFYSSEREPERIMSSLARTFRSQRLIYALTSFAASFLISPFVRGLGVVEFYIENRGDIDKWVKFLNLKPVEAGANVVLLVPYDQGVFYKTQKANGLNLVGNIQMYLDLYSNPARGKEQAEFLREKKMSF